MLRVVNNISAALSLSDAPWWARALIIAIFYLGLPTVLVVILLGMGVGWVPSPITETHQIITSLRENLAQHRIEHVRMLRLLDHICRQTAYTSPQMAECNRLMLSGDER